MFGKTYQSNSLAGLYRELYNDMIDAPEISPRELKTKEIIAPQLILTNPRSRLAFHEDRRFNLKYALVESLMIFDMSNELKYFEKFNENIRQFSDDGGTLYGAYGKRIAEHIPELIYKLKNDYSSRQAVLSIYNNDLIEKTKDMPCTLTLQFLIRDGKLNMITTMRSNDIMWGTPYDIFVFTTMQEIIANTLGIAIGWYTHRPGSLHLYEHHYELFEKIANNFKQVDVVIPYNYATWIMLKNDYKYFVEGRTRGIDFWNEYEMLRKIFKGEI